MQKTIVITGVTSGIGLETAILFAGLGYRIIGIGRNEKTWDENLSKFEGDNHLFFQYDLQDIVGISDFVQGIVHKIGNIDVLINNAGIGLFEPLKGIKFEEEQRLINVNLVAPIELTKAFLPYINTGGSIINISSVAGKRAFKNLTVYCATKSGLIGFSNSLRRELKFQGRDIHIGVVCPPATKTKFFSNAGYHTFEKDHPMLELTNPELVAKEIYRCINSKKREVVVTFRARLLDKLASILPGLVEALEDYVANRSKK